MKTNEPRQLRVLLALLYYPITIFLQAGRDIVVALTGNTNYTTPFPALADVTAALDDLQAKIEAAAGRDQTAMAARNQSRENARSLFRQLANYVQAHCQNNLEILLSTGFHPTKTPAPVGALPAPQNLHTSYNGKDGEVILRMNRVPGVRGGVYRATGGKRRRPLDRNRQSQQDPSGSEGSRSRQDLLAARLRQWRRRPERLE